MSLYMDPEPSRAAGRKRSGKRWTFIHCEAPEMYFWREGRNVFELWRILSSFIKNILLSSCFFFFGVFRITYFTQFIQNYRMKSQKIFNLCYFLWFCVISWTRWRFCSNVSFLRTSQIVSPAPWQMVALASGAGGENRFGTLVAFPFGSFFYQFLCSHPDTYS